jgi:hypothetical protein
MALHLYSDPGDPGGEVAHEEAMHERVGGNCQGIQFLSKLIDEPVKFADLFAYGGGYHV